MYVRNEKTDTKVYQTYLKRYNAMCIMRGPEKLTDLYTKDKFLEIYNQYFRERGTVTNAITVIVQKQIIK